MGLPETTIDIPWNPGTRVPVIEGVGGWLRGELPAQVRPLVPRSITIYREPGAPAAQARELLDLLRGALREEFGRWLARAERMVRLGLYERDEILGRLEAREDAHPWAICVTAQGGLGLFEANSVPCVSVKNHAIAWLPTHEPEARVSALVTARALGKPWDTDDLGHECGHATAFPIALCAQDGSVVDAMPTEPSPSALQPNHLRKLHYTLAEGANAVVRGETRPTATGFAVLHSRDELLAFLRVCGVLFPGLGFDGALRAYEAWRESFLPADDDVTFRVAAPFLRATHRLAPNLRRLGSPVLAWVS